MVLWIWQGWQLGQSKRKSGVMYERLLSLAAHGLAEVFCSICRIVRTLLSGSNGYDVTCSKHLSVFACGISMFFTINYRLSLFWTFSSTQTSMCSLWRTGSAAPYGRKLYVVFALVWGKQATSLKQGSIVNWSWIRSGDLCRSLVPDSFLLCVHIHAHT